MKSLFCAAVAAIFALMPVWAADASPDKEKAPWAVAEAALKAAVADARTGGIAALRSHVVDLEDALAEAPKAFAVPEKGDVVVLADGMADTIMAMVIAQKAYPGRNVVAMRDPYPAIAFYLGSYYNETRKPEDALRVFDLERALEPHSLSPMRPSLITERAIALSSVKRLPDALAAYDEGLKIEGLDNRDKARMWRGRGFVLTDLERLDEAETAYNESLKIEPDNALAKRELDYIKRLRLGGNKSPSEVLIPKDKQNPK